MKKNARVICCQLLGSAVLVAAAHGQTLTIDAGTNVSGGAGMPTNTLTSSNAASGAPGSAPNTFGTGSKDSLGTLGANGPDLNSNNAGKDGTDSATQKSPVKSEKEVSSQETTKNDTQNLTSEPVKSPSEIEFQRFVKLTTGQSLGLYGYQLFGRNPFTPVEAQNVPDGYRLGAGDELIISSVGLLDISERFTIDREGRINLPKTGPLSLAGIPFSDVEKVIENHLAKVFKNFKISVSLGRLRSIEVVVLGQALKPGKHFVSSLSSFVSALYQTGGPTANGSLRTVELRRSGKTVATLDLYALLNKGEVKDDIKLLSGDVIYFPPAGPRAALLGTVHEPSIYELIPGETIQSILNLSGGLPFLATPQKAQLERLQSSREIARYVEDFALDQQGLNRSLQAGDVLTIFQISPQIANVVTLQGNVAAPMRYTFQSGMKVSDLLSDTRLLIPGSYWYRQNAGDITSNYSRPEVNLDYAVIQRLEPKTLRTTLIAFNLRKAIAKDPSEDLTLQSGDIVNVYKPGEAGPETANSLTITGEIIGGKQRFAWRPGISVSDIIPNTAYLIDYYNYWQRPSGNSLRNDINWNYAQIIRRDPNTLSTSAITFNLGEAILKGNPGSDVKLQAGDEIRLFTTAQLPLPVQYQTQLVTISGEVKAPGVYQIQPGETLPQLLRRAGGVTPQAFVYGLEFRRDSVRQMQQQNLNRLIQRIETQQQVQASTLVANRLGGSTDAANQLGLILQQQQQQMNLQIGKLRSVKSSGRISLQLDPQDNELAALPPVKLFNADEIYIPTTPDFVSAVGSVNNESVTLFKLGQTVSDLIQTAALDQDAEPDLAFIVRADGSILTKSSNSSFFGSRFESIALMPGDTLVVPAKVDRESRYTAIMRGFKDWTQILSNFGIGAAALKSLGY